MLKGHRALSTRTHSGNKNELIKATAFNLTYDGKRVMWWLIKWLIIHVMYIYVLSWGKNQSRHFDEHGFSLSPMFVIVAEKKCKVRQVKKQKNILKNMRFFSGRHTYKILENILEG